RPGLCLGLDRRGTGEAHLYPARLQRLVDSRRTGADIVPGTGQAPGATLENTPQPDLSGAVAGLRAFLVVAEKWLDRTRHLSGPGAGPAVVPAPLAALAAQTASHQQAVSG